MPAYRDNKKQPNLLMWPSALKGMDICLGLAACAQHPAWHLLRARRSVLVVKWVKLRPVGCGGCSFCSGFQWKTWLKSPDVFAEMFPQPIRRKVISRTLISWWSEPQLAVPWRYQFSPDLTQDIFLPTDLWLLIQNHLFCVFIGNSQ